MRRDVRFYVVIVIFVVAYGSECGCWETARLYIGQLEPGGGSVSNSDGVGDGYGVALLYLRHLLGF